MMDPAVDSASTRVGDTADMTLVPDVCESPSKARVKAPASRDDGKDQG